MVPSPSTSSGTVILTEIKVRHCSNGIIDVVVPITVDITIHVESPTVSASAETRLQSCWDHQGSCRHSLLSHHHRCQCLRSRTHRIQDRLTGSSGSVDLRQRHHHQHLKRCSCQDLSRWDQLGTIVAVSDPVVVRRDLLLRNRNHQRRFEGVFRASIVTVIDAITIGVRSRLTARSKRQSYWNSENRFLREKWYTR